jgi:hypothetical protein
MSASSGSGSCELIGSDDDECILADLSESEGDYCQGRVSHPALVPAVQSQASGCDSDGAVLESSSASEEEISHDRGSCFVSPLLSTSAFNGRCVLNNFVNETALHKHGMIISGQTCLQGNLVCCRWLASGDVTISRR